jgi:pyrimidine-nucleoside phosphorylase
LQISDLIANKQSGREHSASEIEWLISNYTSGAIPDYQMSAWLMAVYFRGMSRPETVSLTRAMIASGKVADLSRIALPRVDKHSTGGVGDKVSLLVAPIVASLGVAVPMVSGRGLGHTGGTLDKLEAIPGFKTALSLDQFAAQIAEIGCALIGQSNEIVPADRKIYALRDVTCTVQSIPLITASILSKKIAEGTESLLLDVKYGSGAVFSEVEDARKLAVNLVEVGSLLGLQVCAILSDMDQPLGKAVGNWLEVRECLNLMSGRSGGEDLKELSLDQAALMLQLAGKYKNLNEARKVAELALASGRGLKKFIEIAQRQGADVSYLRDPQKMRQAPYDECVLAPQSGFVQELNALMIGKAAISLGAGRYRKEDAIDPVAGIVLHIKRGEFVNKGEWLATLYTSDPAKIAEAFPLTRDTFLIGAEPPPERSRIIAIIDNKGERSWND